MSCLRALWRRDIIRLATATSGPALLAAMGALGHWGRHSHHNWIHDCETRWALPFDSPLLFSSPTQSALLFPYLLFLCQHPLVFSSFLLFDPWYLHTLPSHRPSFLRSRRTGVWLRSVYAVAPAWIVHEVCVKGVTPRPPSSLSLIATCISNGEPCLLNRVSVWFSALSVRALFYSGRGSLRRHSPVHVKVDALLWFISVTQPAIEKFGKLTSLRACRWMLGEAETTGAALMQSNSPLTGKGGALRDWAV